MEQPSEPLTAPSEIRLARLWNRDFVLLWQGQTISQLGNMAFSMAMMLWLKAATGSASLMGLLMFTSMIPGVLLGPFGGTFADRHPRIRIALVCDVLCGLAVLGLAAAMFDPRVERLDPAAVRWVIGLMFGVSALLGVLRAFFTPALSAAIPDLVPREQVTAANSLNQISVQGSALLGQAAGGVLYQFLGPAFLFLIDGSSYLYAGLCAGLVREPARLAEARPAAVHPFRQFLRETAEGFRFVWRQTGLRDFVVIASGLNFLSMPILVLAPFYVDLYLRAETRWYGFLMAAVGAGQVAGFGMAGALRLGGAARRRWIFASLLLTPALFVAVGMARDRFLALGGVFLIGLALGIINVYFLSLLQTATPREMRGRVMSVAWTLSGSLMPIGMVVGGVVGDLTGKNIPLVYGVCGVLGVIVASAAFARPELRRFLAEE